MKRTACTNRRNMRWSLGCAHLEMTGAPIVRPASLRYRFASRGNAAV